VSYNNPVSPNPFVSRNRHHVTLGLPLPRGIWIPHIHHHLFEHHWNWNFTITIALHRSWIVLLFSTCLIQSHQTRRLFKPISFTNPRSGPCWAISRKATRTPTIRISSSTLSICISPVEHYTLTKHSLQLRDPRCNSNPPFAIKRVPPLIRGQTFVLYTEPTNLSVSCNE